MAKSVKVTWTTQDTALPAGTKVPSYFHVGLALQELSVPLAERTCTFNNVEPGVMAGFVVVCAADGTELAPPITFNVNVPTDVLVPVPVTVNGQVV